MSEPLTSIDNSLFAVLVVEDEATALKQYERILHKEGYCVHSASNGEHAVDQLRALNIDVVLTDLVLGGIDGLEVLRAAKKCAPEPAVVILTGHGSIDNAIEATKEGAFSYVQKPVQAMELRRVVRQAVERQQLLRRVAELETRCALSLSEIIGDSPQIVAIKRLIEQIRNSDANVLITGASGTGKELVTRAIHQRSRRSQHPFVALNCASLTDNLVANELFGHEKDAFTGATSTRRGLFESAHGGTLFLDEVGDMPLDMQAKVLRVIQEKELLRVGSVAPVRVDVRIIASTHRDLKSLCAAGMFRQDLFYRLNVISIQLPNLSDRREDIAMLATCFLRRAAKSNDKTFSGFTADAIKLLLNYSYPGNVRELENIVERAVATATGSQIGAMDLPADLRELQTYTFDCGTAPTKTLREIEAEYIRWVLNKVQHNNSEAARILGIDRVSLYRKLKKIELTE